MKPRIFSAARRSILFSSTVNSLLTRKSAFILVGSIAATSLQAASYSWNTTTGTWNTSSANWTGAGTTWVNGNDAVFNNTATLSTITLSGTISAGTVTFGSTANNNANYTLSGGTLNVSGAFNVQGSSNNGPYITEPTVTVSTTNVAVTGNTTVGRANLVISGGNFSTASFVQASGSADWANLIIKGTANVTAGSINLSNVSSATGQLVLSGGTLTTGSIKAVDRGEGFNNTSILLFNGTQVIASADSATFISMVTGSSGADQAYIGTRGALINTNSYSNTITSVLKDLNSTIVTNNNGLDGAAAGAGFLTKSGLGTLTLSGANTFSGVTTLAGGVLNVSSLSNYGVAGGLGNRAAASDAGGNIGILFQGGTLQYTGPTAQSTNRAIRISTTGGATIDASGSIPAATLSFTAASSPNFFENPGARTLTFTGSNTGANTFAMAINEAGGPTSVAKNGVGQWVLTGNNTYTGATTISAGTLKTGSTTALGSTSGLSISAGATLDLGGQNTTLATLSTATGTITDSSAAGSGGILQISGSLGGGNATLVTGSVGVQVQNNNGGTLLTNTANTYSGGTYLGIGTSQARWVPSGTAGSGSPGALTNGIFGTGTIHIGKTTADRGTIYLQGAATVNNAITYNSQLGTDTGGAVRVDATGVTFAGVQTAGATAMTFAPFTGGTLTITGQMTGSGTFTGTTSASFFGTGYAIGTNAGLIIGSSTGAGGIATIILNNASGNSNYVGDTYVTASGILQTNAASQLPSGAGTGNLYLDGKFNLQGSSQATGLLSGTGTVDGVSGTPTLTIGANNATGLTFSGVIKNTLGTLALTKTGTGTQTLSGTNTYTGATTVSSGTLSLGNGSTTGSLSTSSAITNNANLTINRSNAVVQGTDFSSAAISGTGSLTQVGSGVTSLTVANTFTGGTAASAGTLLVNGGVAGTSSGTGTGSVSVSSAATLGGSGNISGATTLTTATLAAGSAAATAGTLTFGAGLALNTGSIFEWDMQQTATTDPGGAPAVGGTNQGVYDNVVLSGTANSLTGTGNAIFKIVLGTGKSFADAFWDTNKTWNNVFSGSGLGTSLSSIFNTFNANGSNLTAGFVAGEGTFTFTGGSTLNWTAVPEPTNAVAALLLGAGLLRRRRAYVN